LLQKALSVIPALHYDSLFADGTWLLQVLVWLQ